MLFLGWAELASVPEWKDSGFKLSHPETAKELGVSLEAEGLRGKLMF